MIDLSKQVKSYLSTSVRNKCLNYLRDNQKYVAEMLDYEGLHVSGGHEQSAYLDGKELEQTIASAIAELPEKCREVFVLSRYEHLKYQEISDKLNISVKTVEAQMSKALQHLRLRLAAYLTTVIGFLVMVFKDGA